MFIDLQNKFGYSEMYEWSELFNYNIVPFGRFVTFSKKESGKIILANDNDFIIGVITINSACVSDDPNEWQGKYLCNQYGDILLEEKNIGHAENAYDDNEEFKYIKTVYNKQVGPVINEHYNNKLSYVKRSNRNEWVRVNLLGKCIVVDDGTLNAGDWCTVGKDGIATHVHMHSINRYYVIDRLTEETIMIFFK